ncbi:MAG TPA: DUF6069 family protein [Acidimicrobiales bacterium]|jgi:hypothetical protein|nr:DUF6069 family protein [Acidimicrobiales bacterium]
MTATMQPTVPSTVTPAPAVSSPARSGIFTRPLWLVGAGAGLVAAAAVALVAAVAKAADVPLAVASSSSSAPEVIPTFGFVTITVMSTAAGIVLAMALARWAKRPARTFTIVAVALTAVSFVLPHTAHNATTATRLVLDLTHVVAAAIVIPALASALAARPARR